MDSWLTEVNDDKPMKMRLQQRMRGNQSENSNDIIMIATMDFRLMEMKKEPKAAVRDLLRSHSNREYAPEQVALTD